MTKNDCETSEQIDVLLVDERPENLLALEAALVSPAYHLVKAGSGDEALRYLLDHDPALILMNVQMPGLDGFETASLIKSSRRTIEIPIIFIASRELDDDYVRKAYEHGAADFVRKPFDSHVLRSKVAIFADLARKTQRLVRTEARLRENERRERDRQIAKLELKSLKRERAEQKKYRDLVEGIDHGVVWSVNTDTGLTTFVGPSAERIFGFPKAAWFSETNFFSQHLHPEDQPQFNQGLDRVAITRRDKEFDHRFIASDGRLVWLHTGIRYAKALEPGKHEIRALSVNITQIKEAEASLHRNKARSDFLAAASALLSESLDTQSSFTHFSRLAVERVCECLCVNLIGNDGKLNTIALSHRDPAAEAILRPSEIQFAPIFNVLATGRSLFVAIITEKMLERWFPIPSIRARIAVLKPRSVIVVPVPVRGRYVGALTLVTSEGPYDEADLTMAEDLGRRVGTALENATLYTQAQEAVRARDEFLSIASHELKTPLTPLKLQTQSLRRALAQGVLQTIGNEKISRMLDSSDRQITRISRLIDDLLDISRINSGKMQLSFEEFRLGDLLQDTVDRFAEEIKIARCTVLLSCPPDLRVLWDRFRIEQVVVNLLTNAIKYGAGGAIEISVAQDKDLVTLSVRDHGIGIAEADQSRVFGRFERAVSGTHFGGLGLGLYIVTQILEAHGGSISVQSRTGEGSTFAVKLAADSRGDARPESAFSANILAGDATTAAPPSVASVMSIH